MITPTTEFDTATVGDTAYVYKGPGVEGLDHAFVTTIDWFDDNDEDTHLIRQVWRLEEHVQVVKHPTAMVCRQCHGEGTVDLSGPRGLLCGVCKGDGRDPEAGQVVVVPSPPVPIQKLIGMEANRVGEHEIYFGLLTVDKMLEFVRSNPNPNMKFTGLEAHRALTTFPEDWCSVFGYFVDSSDSWHAHGPTLHSALEDAVRLIMERDGRELPAKERIAQVEAQR